MPVGQEGQAGAGHACRRAVLSAYRPQRRLEQEHRDGYRQAEQRRVLSPAEPRCAPVTALDQTWTRSSWQRGRSRAISMLFFEKIAPHATDDGGVGYASTPSPPP